ncbi:zinc finger, CCHC-type containing protein [Tanacetum coccineum]
MAGNTMKDMTTNFGKLDKFERHDFRRWQKKMHFLLTTLKVVYVLTTLMPELVEDATMEAIRIRAKWENDDYICRNHILNGMSGSLFDAYTNVESAKELWDSLKSKYMAEDSSSKKFLYNELLRILRQYIQHGLKMDESIFVSSIIDKLPPSWKDFKHTLEHGKYDLSLVQLGSHLRIEESLRAQDSDKGMGKEVGGPSVNMTEEGKNKHNKQNKGKKRSNENNSGSSSNKKPKLECWKCGKTGQFKRDCRSGKKNNANSGGSGPFQRPRAEVDAIAWWIDFGATTYVCKDHCWFKTFELVEDGSVLYMGDEHFAPVHGKGSVALEFSSGKTITLFNVLYVPKLCKNLVFGHVLNKCGYKQVYKSDKYILVKSGVFIGFGYYNNGMFMLNLNKVPNDSDSVYMSSSTVVNSSLWLARLGHVHYKRMLEMSKDDLIPAIDENLEKFNTFWGCRAVVRHPDLKRKTLGEKGIDCIFIGYAKHSKPYRFYVIEPNDSKEAIDDEIGSIMENNTWVLSVLPPSCKPLGCKWIFKRKMNVDGIIDKFKARLVIQGFRQKEGIDYFDTYAQVTRITTIILLLALAAIHNIVIHQMDVKTAFLNGDLDEEVYMKQPEGFVMLSNKHKVCKLVKSLYGLKQAPKQWHQKFDEVVSSSGFHLNQYDKCVYSKFDSSSKGVIIWLYVNDMLIFKNDQDQVDKTNKFFSSNFSMKDIGEADVILGIKIKREAKGIVITQSHCIEKILKKFNRKDCTKDYGLSYVGYPSVLEGYSDASWINHAEYSSSTSVWVFLLRGGAISRASKKQTCITGSTMEY